MTEPSLPIWLGACVALVLLLQAGLALAYAGASRAKDAVNVLLQAFVGTAAVALAYWAVGDALAHGASAHGWWGTAGFAASPSEPPAAAALLFRLMLAGTAFVIVCGAVAERLRAPASLLFAVVLGGVLYPVLAHWTGHPQGWLKQLGVVDLGGAASIHALAACCALAGALVLGPRLGRFGSDGSVRPIPGHHLPMAIVGIWVAGAGWLGLHAGDALLAEPAVAPGRVLLNTVLAAAAGTLGATAWAWRTGQAARMRSITSGFIAGIVAISAGAATLAAAPAVLTGAVAGWLCNAGARRLQRWRIDDASDAVSVHGLGALWGLLAAGLFHAGDAFSLDRVLVQALAGFATFAWALPVAYLALRGIERLGGLRLSPVDEMRGADHSQQRELAYPEFNDGVARLRQEG